MLIYFGFGRRDYHANSIPVHRRNRWSCQVVLKGEIAMVEEEGPGFFKKQHLWLCRPDFSYGWTGVPGKPAEVAVFSFASLPSELVRRLDGKTFVEIDLSHAQRDKVRELAATTARYWRTSRPARFLYFEQTRFALSILVCENLKGPVPEELFELLPQQRVLRAVHYFEDHLGHAPSLEEVSRATGVSSSQLRRDFSTTLRASPKKTFDDIRLRHALELLRQSDRSIEAVAEACGFWSASAFSRAFKAKFNQSPRKLLPRKTRGATSAAILPTTQPGT